MEKFDDFIGTLCQMLNADKKTFDRALERDLLDISEFCENVYRITHTDKTEKFLSKIDERIRTSSADLLYKILDSEDLKIEQLIIKLNPVIFFTTDDIETFKQKMDSELSRDVNNLFLFKKIDQYNIGVKKPWWYNL